MASLDVQPSPPWTPTPETVVALFVLGHVRAMLRHMIVSCAISIGSEPSEEMIATVAGDLEPHVTPAISDWKADLAHDSGILINSVIENHIQWFECYGGGRH